MGAKAGRRIRVVCSKSILATEPAHTGSMVATSCVTVAFGATAEATRYSQNAEMLR